MAEIKGSSLIDSNDFEKTFEVINNSIEKTIGLVKELSITVKKDLKSVDLSNIKAADVKLIENANKKTERYKEISAELVAQQKESDRIKKALFSSQAKLNSQVSAENYQLEKNKQALNEANKNMRQRIKLEGTAKDSLARLKVQLSQLNSEYNRVSASQRQKLAPQINRLNQKILEQEKAVGKAQRQVGFYDRATSKLTGIFTGLVAGLGTARLATKLFTGTIENSQKAGDSWAISIAGLKGAFDGFFQALGSGNMDSVIDFMVRGKKAAEEFTAATDDLFEGGKGAQILTAEYDVLIAKQETLRKNTALSSRDRLTAAEKIAELEILKLNAIQEENQKLYDRDIKFLKTRTKIKEDEIISFLKNYREEEKLRSKAIEFLELEKEAADLVKTQRILGDQFLTAKTQEQQNERVDNFYDSMSTEERIYLEFYKKYQTTTDEMVGNVADSYAKILEAQTRSIKQQMRNETDLARFRKELYGEIRDDIKIDEKLEPKQIENVGAGIDDTVGSTIELSNATKELTQDYRSLSVEFDKINDAGFMDNMGTWIDQNMQHMQSFHNSLSQLGDLVQNQADINQKVIDEYSTSLESLESKMDVEREKMSKGQANTFKQDERLYLEQSKRRDQALRDQEKYNKEIIALNKAEQASQLLLAVANIFSKSTKAAGPLGVAAAAISAGLMLSSFIAIESDIDGFKDGVISLDGAGTETSDSIPARLSKNESVINARGTKGAERTLTAINNNELKDKDIEDALSLYDEIGKSQLTQLTIKNMSQSRSNNSDVVDAINKLPAKLSTRFNTTENGNRIVSTTSNKISTIRRITRKN